MAKKILLIGLFTGLAHLLSFYGVSFIVKMNADKLFISKIGEIESAIAIILSVLSFGLQQVATRDIAITDNWKPILKYIQVHRFSMGLSIALIGSLFYFIYQDSYYLIFLLAPLIALNIDYALYGRGLSIEASFLSFIKVGIPSIILIILAFNDIFNINYYVIAIIIAWLIIGFLSNKYLKHVLLVKPVFGFLKAYLKNVKIGFTDIALASLKLGILTLAQPFYDDTVIANAFVVLKLYILVKGIQRVVFQAFYKDLVDLNKALLIDKIGLLMGFVFFVITLFYPEELISLFFSQEYLETKNLFRMIGFATLISSISITASPRMLLINKDRAYINSYIYALVVVLIVLFTTSKSTYVFYGIIGAVLAGELVLNIMFFINLKEDIFTKERVMFLLEVFVLFLVIIGVYLFLDSLMSMLINCMLFIVYFLYFLSKNKKQFI